MKQVHTRQTPETKQAQSLPENALDITLNKLFLTVNFQLLSFILFNGLNSDLINGQVS
jgi:hypothetical protein